MELKARVPLTITQHAHTGTGHTGTQVHRHRAHRYTAHRNTDTQVHRYTGTQVHRHRAHRHRAHRYTGTQAQSTQAHRYTAHMNTGTGHTGTDMHTHMHTHEGLKAHNSKLVNKMYPGRWLRYIRTGIAGISLRCPPCTADGVGSVGGVTVCVMFLRPLMMLR